jgi:hypothetical protein
LASDAERDQADASAIEVVHGPQQIYGASGKPIRLTGHRGVTSADGVDRALGGHWYGGWYGRTNPRCADF